MFSLENVILPNAKLEMQTGFYCRNLIHFH